MLEDQEEYSILQKKFREWFGKTVPVVKPLPDEAGHSIGNPIPIKLPLPAKADHVYHRTRRNCRLATSCTRSPVTSFWWDANRTKRSARRFFGGCRRTESAPSSCTTSAADPRSKTCCSRIRSRGTIDTMGRVSRGLRRVATSSRQMLSSLLKGIVKSPKCTTWSLRLIRCISTRLSPGL